MEKKRYEVFQTNPFVVGFEGTRKGAFAFYNVVKQQCFEQNQTAGIRVLNSYHWEWVGMYRYFGYTGVNPENGKEFFVIDFDHPFNNE